MAATSNSEFVLPLDSVGYLHTKNIYDRNERKRIGPNQRAIVQQDAINKPQRYANYHNAIHYQRNTVRVF